MTDINTIAQTYIDGGWAVVPLRKGEKRASGSWTKHTYTADAFKADDGIGGKCGEPSGWRVDVDLDHPLAVEIAPRLLPATGLVHGRPGKPLSHYWYVCKGIKTRQFTNVTDGSGQKAMLVELRSTGGYTALPPSGHPSGDVLAWASDGLALRVTEPELVAPVSHVAIATLIAIHWPGPGARHAMVGHLAAFLCKHGVPALVVPRIIEAAATAAHDSDLNDRMNFARTTVQKHLADNEAQLTAGPKLAEILGHDVVGRLRSWLGASDTDAIEEMNATHFWVRMGKDDVIGREDDPDEIVFQRPHALYSEYADRQVQVGVRRGEAQFKPLVHAWLASPQRRRYRKVVFAPPPMVADKLDYNLWRGYAVEPTPARADKVIPILRHIREIICNDDPECYDYLMKLLALTVQRPGERTGIAVVMRSPEGGGKNIFVDCIGNLFHPHHYVAITKWSQVTGRFNASLKGKVVVYLNELGAATASEVGSLKSLITDERVNIEPKGVDPTSVDNHAHVFMGTNEDWAVPMTEESRRFFCLRLSDRYAYGHCSDAERKAYFDPLFELRNDKEALGGLLYRLMQDDLSNFDRFAKPETNEEREQRLRSQSGPIQWLFDVLETGRFGLLGWPTEEVELSRVYNIYETWARTLGQRPLDTVQWGKKVAKCIWVGGETRATRIKNDPTRVGTLVTRDALRAALPPLTTFKKEVTTYIVKRSTILEDVTFATDRAATAATGKRDPTLF